MNGSGPREHVQVEVHDVALLEHEVEGLESELDHRVVWLSKPWQKRR